MNSDIEVYAEWLRRQGQRVIRTTSGWWHSEGYGVYQAFPYHWLIEPSAGEIRELMWKHRALALRYSSPARDGAAEQSYHAVYTGADYGLETLSSWARKNVRRGLRNCTVEPISFPRYLDEGWELRTDTLARQGRDLGESKTAWCKRYAAAADLEGFEVWAALAQEQLAATLVTFQMDGWGYMIYQQCHHQYLREHVNNALGFVVTQTLIRRPGIRGIFYGMKSLDAPPSVDEFKFRMGYEAQPVRQQVVFHPGLAPLVNPLTHGIAKGAVALSPHSRLLAKAEGMLRLHLAGRRSEGVQAVPANATQPAKPPVTR
jgi:hypothetical protein